MLSHKSLILSFVSIYLGVIPLLQAQESSILYVGEVTGSHVNIRTGPHTSHRIVYTAPQGQKLYALEENNDWVKVKLPEEANVWIHGDLVNKVSNTRGIVTKGAVNLRVRPSTNTFIMGQAHKDQEVTIRGEKFGWYQIQTPDNLNAWIVKIYFKKLMSLNEFRKQQRTSKVQSIYRNIEQIHNEELLKPKDQRDYSFLLDKYKYLMNHFPDFPEAKLAEYRYKEVQGWLAEKAWNKLELSWQQALKSSQETIDMKSFISRYKKFISLYPKTSYTDITKERLHFLEKTTTIARFNGVSMLKQGQTRESNLKGVVHDLGKLINRPATHKLVRDGEIICLIRSEKFDLGDYVYRNVELKGSLIDVKGWDIPILDVKDIKVHSWKGKF